MSPSEGPPLTAAPVDVQAAAVVGGGEPLWTRARA